MQGCGVLRDKDDPTKSIVLMSVADSIVGLVPHQSNNWTIWNLEKDGRYPVESSHLLYNTLGKDTNVLKLLASLGDFLT